MVGRVQLLHLLYCRLALVLLPDVVKQLIIRFLKLLLLPEGVLLQLLRMLYNQVNVGEQHVHELCERVDRVQLLALEQLLLDEVFLQAVHCPVEIMPHDNGDEALGLRLQLLEMAQFASHERGQVLAYAVALDR